jgi:hypothetical protein
VNDADEDEGMALRIWGKLINHPMLEELRATVARMEIMVCGSERDDHNEQVINRVY